MSKVMTGCYDTKGDEIYIGCTVAPGGIKEHQFKVEIKQGVIGGMNSDGNWIDLHANMGEDGKTSMLIVKHARAKRRVVKTGEVKFDDSIPETIGECADVLYNIRQQRLNIDKESKKLKDYEAKLSNHIIDELPKSNASGVSGRVANVKSVVSEVPTVQSQEELRNYVIAHERWDLVTNLRPSAPAVRDMWEAGEEIPGVEKFNQVKVSLTKV